jgi:hypothetical protein
VNVTRIRVNLGKTELLGSVVVICSSPEMVPPRGQESQGGGWVLKSYRQKTISDGDCSAITKTMSLDGKDSHNNDFDR